jgi:Zn-finger nucleic acid-binding protein
MLKCPKCKIPLCRVQYEGVPVDLCPDGHGRIIEVRRAEQIVKRLAAQGDAIQKDTVETLLDAVGPDAHEPIRCPKCLNPMEKAEVLQFHMDYCPPCGLMWCDPGKLECWTAVKAMAIQSQTPEEIALREKLALTELERQDRLQADSPGNWVPGNSAWHLLGYGPGTAADLVDALDDANNTKRPWQVVAARRRLIGVILVGVLPLLVYLLIRIWARS